MVIVAHDSDVNKIQEGIGDKMSSFFQWMSTFLTGLIIGFVHGPKLAAVVIAISPLVAISGGIMTYVGGTCFWNLFFYVE